MVQVSVSCHDLKVVWWPKFAKIFVVSSRVDLAGWVRIALILLLCWDYFRKDNADVGTGRCRNKYTVHLKAADLLWRSKNPFVLWSHIKCKSILYECTETACKKCIITDFVGAFGTGDIPRGLLGDATHLGPQPAGQTGLWLRFDTHIFHRAGK